MSDQSLSNFFKSPSSNMKQLVLNSVMSRQTSSSTSSSSISSSRASSSTESIRIISHVSLYPNESKAEATIEALHQYYRDDPNLKILVLEFDDVSLTTLIQQNRQKVLEAREKKMKEIEDQVKEVECEFFQIETKRLAPASLEHEINMFKEKKEKYSPGMGNKIIMNSNGTTINYLGNCVTYDSSTNMYGLIETLRTNGDKEKNKDETLRTFIEKLAKANNCQSVIVKCSLLTRGGFKLFVDTFSDAHILITHPDKEWRYTNLANKDHYDYMHHAFKYYIDLFKCLEYFTQPLLGWIMNSDINTSAKSCTQVDIRSIWSFADPETKSRLENVPVFIYKNYDVNTKYASCLISPFIKKKSTIFFD